MKRIDYIIHMKSRKIHTFVHCFTKGFKMWTAVGKTMTTVDVKDGVFLVKK